MIPHALIYALFFVSGAAGLVYQVAWVRAFGTVFGSTVHSASIVAAIFMLGLGVGSLLAGRHADRRGDDADGGLVRLYGLFEIGIGVWGLGVAALLPQLSGLSSALSTYVAGANGFFEPSLASRALVYAIAVVVLLPSTLLMGGTLTLLVRHLVRHELRLAGHRVGMLYGINTLGAAAGAFAVDFALVPTVGLLATQSLAAVANLAVGVVALRAGRVGQGGVATAAATSAAGATADARARMWAVAAAMALSGFAAMGLEIAWFRICTTILWANRSTFSLLLTVILIGIWAGSWLGGALQRRFGHPARLYAWAQAVMVASALGLLALWEPALLPRSAFAEDWLAAGPFGRRFWDVWSQLRIVLFVVGLPALAMGLSFPLANAVVQRAHDAIGGRAGMLYLANTVGAVLGSLAVGFGLLPLVGIQHTIALLGVVALLAGAPLLWIAARDGGAPSSLRWSAPAAMALAGVVLAVFATLPEHHLPSRLYAPMDPRERLVAFSEGVNETIVVSEFPQDGSRRLYTNGFSMTSTRYSAQRYMRAFTHVPLLAMPAPARVLVICFGVGNTTHSATLHPSVQRVDLADLSRHVLEHAPLFRRWNHDVLRSPKVRAHVNDGRQHLRMMPPETYDLVTLEPPPIGQAGVAGLYSVEFYELARTRLREGGHLTQWLPAYQVPPSIIAAIIGAFVEVFPDAVMLSGYHSELILLGRKGGPPILEPAEVAARLAERPAVAADLAAIDLGSVADIAGTFVSSARALREVAETALPVRDDYPIMEYGSMTYHQTVLQKALFVPGEIGSWCPRCFDAAGAEAAEVRGLGGILAYAEALYATLAFRATTVGAGTEVAPLVITDPTRRAAAANAYETRPYWRRVGPPPAD